MKKHLSQIREDYLFEGISKHSAGQAPWELFEAWWQAHMDQAAEEIGNEFILATASPSGYPESRIMLLKAFDSAGFQWFTNYKSLKAQQLSENPKASMLFFFNEVARQIRIKGSTERLSRSENEAYFATRPRESQIAAWASEQSTEIESREVLEAAYEAIELRFQDQKIPCPEHWGGYRLIAEAFEFWQGRKSRFHDRIVFEKIKGNQWRCYRQAP